MIIQLFANIGAWFINILPPLSLPVQPMIEGINFIMSYVGMIDAIFPIEHIEIGIKTYIVVFVLVLQFKILLFVFRTIRLAF